MSKLLGFTALALLLSSPAHSSRMAGERATPTGSGSGGGAVPDGRSSTPNSTGSGGGHVPDGKCATPNGTGSEVPR